MASTFNQQLGDHMRLRDLGNYLSGRDTAPRLDVTSPSTALARWDPARVPAPKLAQELAQDAGQHPHSTAEREYYYVTAYNNVVVDLTPHARPAPSCPSEEAAEFIAILMSDPAFAGRWVTTRALIKRYAMACDGVKPYPWLKMARHFYCRLSDIWGGRELRSWERVPIGRKIKRMRTVRIPTLGEAAAANLARQNPDQVLALHQRG